MIEEVTERDFVDYATQSDRLMLFRRLLADRDALKDRVKKYDTVWGELVAHHDEWKSQAQTLAARVRKQNDVIAELTAALKKIATTSQREAREDSENLILIAQEVLIRDCGNCGDDGEEPSSNCPTCHGTGFKALAPPVGEKEK